LEANLGFFSDNCLTTGQLTPFAGYFDKVLYYDDTPLPNDPILNPATNYKDIEEEYSRTRIVYLDAFLTESALTALRRFLLTSSVFFRHSEAGFVGSYLTEGLTSPVILKIAAALHERMPNILRDRPLNNAWCYRYDSKGSGVKPHNGDGSVTLNFWLTPDEANRIPGSGGMTIYSKEHPKDWDWLYFNMYKDRADVQAQIASYLSDSSSVVVPYKCNRAVLFHSTLFHKSDAFDFVDCFSRRRMNITMLFGHRGQEAARLS